MDICIPWVRRVWSENKLEDYIGILNRYYNVESVPIPPDDNLEPKSSTPRPKTGVVFASFHLINNTIETNSEEGIAQICTLLGLPNINVDVPKVMQILRNWRSKWSTISIYLSVVNFYMVGFLRTFFPFIVKSVLFLNNDLNSFFTCKIFN